MINTVDYFFCVVELEDGSVELRVPLTIKDKLSKSPLKEQYYILCQTVENNSEFDKTMRSIELQAKEISKLIDKKEAPDVLIFDKEGRLEESNFH